MKLAPIVLFVYNRPWHTKQTLEALMANELSASSDLYIYCDGPKGNATLQDLEKIEEVKSLVKSSQWCKEVIIKERSENLGLAESVIQGVTEVIKEHGKIIVLEDDLVTGQYFLKFMNDGLNTYQDDKKVFGISGYKYPSNRNIKESTYFLPIPSSWSFATWKDRWDKVNFYGKELLEKIDKQNLQKQFDFGGNPFYVMLQDHIANKNNSWAIRFYASMFLNNAYFLYPNKSLVENIGFDGTGVHCGEDNYFSKVKKNNDQIILSRIKIELKGKSVNPTKKCFEENFCNRTFNFKQVISSFFQRLFFS